MIKKGQKIHTRKIDIATYEGVNDSIIVEGILKDDRMFESYQSQGKRRPPGTIHHMIIRMEVTESKLRIKDIEVEMPTVPNEVCNETLKCLEPVKGLSIVPGFTGKIRDLAGGPKGCTHLLTLLTSMAPAAVQGAFSQAVRKPLDPKISGPIALKRFKDTCWAWREDGPIVKRIKDQIE